MIPVLHRLFRFSRYCVLGALGLSLVLTSHTARADDTDLQAEMVEIGVNDSSSEVRDALVFRVRANDPTEGDDDGDGIRNVDLIILDEDGREVYRKRENNAGYCAFGGGEPNCTEYDFSENDNEWPNGDPIRDRGEYTLRAIVNAEDGRQAVIEQTVVIELDDDESQQALEADFMQTGRSGNSGEVRDALVFRVRANDPTEGNDDGDGIRNVDMIILDEDGREVYRKRENNAGYCAFGGGEPNCTEYNFDDNDNEWPNGEPIRDRGEYTLRAIVNADDGRQAVIEQTVVIELDDSNDDLRVELMQTGRSGSSSVAEDALVFRVRANDPRVGNRDGAGIRFVDMIVLDEDGREVHRKRETSAGYCAFGGGTPNCTVWDFDDNDNEWPNGEEIRRGTQHTLRAIVTAQDGRRTTFETEVEIR